MGKGWKTLLAFALTTGLIAGGALPGASTQRAEAAAAATKTYGYSDPAAGRTYVPLRVLSTFAGAKISGKTGKGKLEIVKGKQRITLHTGRKKAEIDGKKVRIDAAPFAYAGVTYVPLGFAAKHLGLTLEWNDATSSMHVASGDKAMDLPIIRRGSLTDRPVSYRQQVFYVGGAAIRANVVTVQLMHPRVSLDAAFAHHRVGTVQNLSAIAAQNGAYAAINATYFDAYSSAVYRAPYGYLVSKGDVKFINGGTDLTVFAYDRNHLARLIPGLQFGKAYEEGQVEGAVQAGPRLVNNGRIAVNAVKEGFRDPSILRGRAARSAIGITRDHKLIMVTLRRSSMPQLAHIMKQAGAYQAMNLDGGASSGLYLNGKYVTKPGRKVSNALLVKVRR
ncbi:phosphodiester glycosidase family protein [Saccharibacillus brassicae]|uniref:Copper amine oxidase n=1 Tax=Saccharibacillus brassicae TaxID=2583377 RepID=A0A4Y6V1Q6_SACBS|nr:phosphodiester glycosidase family protein [Saccharibacillus brassicae]QDH22185.1 copper amine oxidase [Saccharibacillus brassicae]